MTQSEIQPICFEDPRPGLSKRVRALREAQGLSLRKLSLMVGLNKNLINDIELGKANPTLVSLAKLAAGLDVKLTDLLD
ncbi:helix-turn-helix domain-containing protein [Gordonibacter urolithinfaciens]|uniref:helix-turn-helix domain-containing protein n=1 Tax=Gordonibacter urolithinfaciens TaxID=1335613 RepID=UPI003AAC119B